MREHVIFSPGQPTGREELIVLAEIVRLAFAWGAMIAIIGFWYWLLGNIGTF